MGPFASIARTIAAGLLTILPIVLTVLIITWVTNFLARWVGPESAFGRALASIGGAVGLDELFAYALGTALVLLALYFLGKLVQSRVMMNLTHALDRVMSRVPLIGTIYSVTNRFVSLLDKRDDLDLRSMSPVWCFFSDAQETAVLGLMPAEELVEIDGAPYRIVLVPTAPIPFGGGLLFLPERWVKPAPFGVEGLTNIYVSMGVSAPNYVKRVPVLVQDPEVQPAPAKSTTRRRRRRRTAPSG